MLLRHENYIDYRWHVLSKAKPNKNLVANYIKDDNIVIVLTQKGN